MPDHTYRQIGDREAPPFSVQLLEQHAVAGQGERDQLLRLLPALYRKDSGDLAAVGQHVTASVEEELDLRRLASIHGWLWVAGLPLPPRALHHQLLLGRHGADGDASRLDGRQDVPQADPPLPPGPGLLGPIPLLRRMRVLTRHEQCHPDGMLCFERVTSDGTNRNL